MATLGEKIESVKIKTTEKASKSPYKNKKME